MNGHPAYKAILDRMWELHCEKARAYGTDSDPLANLRESADIGIEPWRACVSEVNSAFYRVKNHCKRGHLKNDSLANALMDSAAFCLLALLFLEEEEESRHAEVADAQFEFENPKSGVQILSEAVVSSLGQMLKDEKWQEERATALTGFVTKFGASPANNPVTNPPWLADVGARMQETLEKAK